MLAAIPRSMVNRHTGFSANMLMLGREALTPVTLPLIDLSKYPSGGEYLKQMSRTLREIRELARNQLKLI